MANKNVQITRLVKLVAELRRNKYPNTESFSKLLRDTDLYENHGISANPRTVSRDFDALRYEYNAPIAYCAKNRGYYLTDTTWEFLCPVLDENFLDMAIIGTRLASDILPQPLNKEVNDAIDQALTTNNPEFFDTAMIESLLCASGIKAEIDPEIFKTVFDAWRMHQTLEITYQSPNAAPSERKFEPHIIVFHKGLWYTKGFEAGTKTIKVYAIQRIHRAAFAGVPFPVNKQLLEDTRKNGLFNYEKINGIKVRCDASIAFYLQEHQKIKQFKIDRQPDGALIVYLRPAIEHEVIRWVLGESGKVEVLEPLSLREKVAAAARQVYEKNR